MPKLLHVADIHIGIENYGRIDPHTGMHTRLLDFLERLDEVIDVALYTEHVDLILIAGDIYKSRQPSPTHQREFAKRIMRVVAAGVPLVLLPGNHDMPGSTGRAHAIEIFGTLDIPHVYLADRLTTLTVPTQHGPVQIIAVPWLNRQALLSKDEIQGLPISAIEKEMIDRVERWLVGAARELDPTVPTVLTFHGTVKGASFGAERSITLGQDLVMPRSVLAVQGVDYIALGHIHKHQVIGNDPPAVYCGSIERIDFGEEREAKGFVLVDLVKGATQWRFVEVNARPFVSIQTDVTLHPDPQQRVLHAIAKHRLQNAIVRLQIKCKPEQRAAIDERELKQALEAAGAAYVGMLGIDVERSERGRFAAVADELTNGTTPRRTLELFLTSKQVGEDRRRTLLEAFDEVMDEDDGEVGGSRE
ncbi:MAG: exonuclease SbcCD subunit D [Herpetosiphon sp.]